MVKNTRAKGSRKSLKGSALSGTAVGKSSRHPQRPIKPSAAAVASAASSRRMLVSSSSSSSSFSSSSSSQRQRGSNRAAQERLVASLNSRSGGGGDFERQQRELHLREEAAKRAGVRPPPRARPEIVLRESILAAGAAERAKPRVDDELFVALEQLDAPGAAGTKPPPRRRQERRGTGAAAANAFQALALGGDDDDDAAADVTHAARAALPLRPALMPAAPPRVPAPAGLGGHLHDDEL